MLWIFGIWDFWNFGIFGTLGFLKVWDSWNLGFLEFWLFGIWDCWNLGFQKRNCLINFEFWKWEFWMFGGFDFCFVLYLLVSVFVGLSCFACVVGILCFLALDLYL